MEAFGRPTAEERRAAREERGKLIEAKVEAPAIVRDTGPTIMYEQYLTHPRLRRMRRVLEVFKADPRMRLRVSIDRVSRPDSAEVFYAAFPLECEGWDVRITNGGVPMRPDADQIPRTCRDYFAIDGPVTYSKGSRKVVLDCRDNALVTFGGMNDGLGLETLGGKLTPLYAILYNNAWFTNWGGDESGLMEFDFDLYAADGRDAGYAPQVFAVVNV
jgi:hypothetical protein